MKILFAILFLTGTIFSQEVNIVNYLKEIESGNSQSAVAVLPGLKKNNPNDPSVIFLDAVLTESGKDALTKYETIYKNHPNSNYADASIYRIFSYYYSLGLYNRAQEYLDELSNKYPNSSYLKIADRNIPEDDLFTEKFTTPVPQKEIEKPIVINETAVEAKFTVQAGAFLNLENAKSLKDNLENDGFRAELSKKEIGGSILNVVIAGKFQTEESAQKLISLLKNKYNLTGRISLIE